ncbi:MAG: hypothetical protein Q7S15_02505 [bacterium]|nr:hypothetical protein [bacterium]
MEVLMRELVYRLIVFAGLALFSFGILAATLLAVVSRNLAILISLACFWGGGIIAALASIFLDKTAPATEN